MSTDIPALRSLILAHLTDISYGSRLLGYYTFKNGAVADAIAVDNQGKYPEPGTKITGLEVVIETDLDARTTPMLGSNLIEYTSKVTLKQWDLTNNTIAATERLIDGLSVQYVIEVGPRLPRVTVIDNLDQCSITVKSLQRRRAIA